MQNSRLEGLPTIGGGGRGRGRPNLDHISGVPRHLGCCPSQPGPEERCGVASLRHSSDVMCQKDAGSFVLLPEGR